MLDEIVLCSKYVGEYLVELFISVVLNVDVCYIIVRIYCFISFVLESNFLFMCYFFFDMYF